ncbi:MAG TPA: hypothetical protein PLC54_07675, partial [Spirochaetales bacterium]|nr:hypothetical protein [Spirochaetales bacterium]
MTRYRSLQRIIVPLILGLVCALLTGTLWMMADREKSTRALALEYRMHRTLSALAELWRGGPLAPEELESLLGFGLYSASGSALYRFGTAPETVDPQDAQKRYGMRFAQDAVSMLSILGRLNPARGMGSMMRPRDSTAPALAWIAVDALPLRRQRLAILLLAGFASAAIAGLFSFSMILYRRYEKSRERDERDRELLQLGQAARTIAHEIKNPLGIVRIQCGVLRKRDNADLAGLSIIEDEVDRLAVMADRIRQFLAGRTPQLSLVNACAFARDYAAR